MVRQAHTVASTSHNAGHPTLSSCIKDNARYRVGAPSSSPRLVGITISTSYVEYDNGTGSVNGSTEPRDFKSEISAVLKPAIEQADRIMNNTIFS